jgi:hypothetical protein
VRRTPLTDRCTYVAPLTWPCRAQEADGRYGPKWCILALKEVGGAGPKRKEPLGRIVLDLSEFAHATGGQAQHSFEIACAADVAAAAGPLPPRVLITLGCVDCCLSGSVLPMFLTRRPAA